MWAVGEREKFHVYLQLLDLIGHVTAWALPPVRSVAALDSHRSMNPTMNFTACALYENLIPDDLKGSWGGNAGPGERLQIQVIVSREVWLHRNHNKLSACRLISKPDQWVASDNCTILSYMLQCNNSRNKVHSKHTLLWIIPETPLAPWFMEKLSSTKPVPKRFGTTALVHLFLLWSLLFLSFYQLGILFVFIFVVLSGVTLGYLFETYFVSWGRLLLL